MCPKAARHRGGAWEERWGGGGTRGTGEGGFERQTRGDGLLLRRGLLRRRVPPPPARVVAARSHQRMRWGRSATPRSRRARQARPPALQPPLQLPWLCLVLFSWWPGQRGRGFPPAGHIPPGSRLRGAAALCRGPQARVVCGQNRGATGSTAGLTREEQEKEDGGVGGWGLPAGGWINQA